VAGIDAEGMPRLDRALVLAPETDEFDPAIDDLGELQLLENLIRAGLTRRCRPNGWPASATGRLPKPDVHDCPPMTY